MEQTLTRISIKTGKVSVMRVIVPDKPKEIPLNEPVRIKEFLSPLVGLKDRPDREEILRNYFKTM